MSTTAKWLLEYQLAPILTAHPKTDKQAMLVQGADKLEPRNPLTAP